MTVSITNLRRRLVTLLVPDGRTVRAVRIAHAHTATGLPDTVLSLPVVQEAQERGEFIVRREGTARVRREKR
jgi:hypothetical protein